MRVPSVKLESGDFTMYLQQRLYVHGKVILKQTSCTLVDWVIQGSSRFQQPVNQPYDVMVEQGTVQCVV